MIDRVIYIAITGKSGNLNEAEIQNAFKVNLENIHSLISHVVEDGTTELIYEINCPVVKTQAAHIDFFKRLLNVFDELKVYNPFFTNYTKGDVK